MFRVVETLLLRAAAGLLLRALRHVGIELLSLRALLLRSGWGWGRSGILFVGWLGTELIFVYRFLRRALRATLTLLAGITLRCAIRSTLLLATLTLLATTKWGVGVRRRAETASQI